MALTNPLFQLFKAQGSAFFDIQRQLSLRPRHRFQPFHQLQEFLIGTLILHEAFGLAAQSQCDGLTLLTKVLNKKDQGAG